MVGGSFSAAAIARAGATDSLEVHGVKNSELIVCVRRVSVEVDSLHQSTFLRRTYFWLLAAGGAPPARPFQEFVSSKAGIRGSIFFQLVCFSLAVIKAGAMTSHPSGLEAHGAAGCSSGVPLPAVGVPTAMLGAPAWVPLPAVGVPTACVARERRR